MGYNVAARSDDECSSDQGSVPDGAIAVVDEVADVDVAIDVKDVDVGADVDGNAVVGVGEVVAGVAIVDGDGDGDGDGDIMNAGVISAAVDEARTGSRSRSWVWVRWWPESRSWTGVWSRSWSWTWTRPQSRTRTWMWTRGDYR
jgi:hypothetical protein